MMNALVPLLYFLAITLLLLQAFKVMSRGLMSINSKSIKTDKSNSDRTGLLTVHPELLNQEGKLTDEDLLTVRFSDDLEPPDSINE